MDDSFNLGRGGEIAFVLIAMLFIAAAVLQGLGWTTYGNQLLAVLGLFIVIIGAVMVVNAIRKALRPPAE